MSRPPASSRWGPAPFGEQHRERDLDEVAVPVGGLDALERGEHGLALGARDAGEAGRPVGERERPAPGGVARAGRRRGRLADGDRRARGLRRRAHRPRIGRPRLRSGRMLAMVLRRPGPAATSPLEAVELPDPVPGEGEVLLAVSACAVCRTDLQLCEGDLEARRLPIVPGHQAVGPGRGRGPGGPRLARGRPRRRLLARGGRRHLPLLPRGPREPLRARGLHGLGPRRRVRRADARSVPSTPPGCPRGPPTRPWPPCCAAASSATGRCA